jgi:plastocyanin domain-containing protein
MNSNKTAIIILSLGVLAALYILIGGNSAPADIPVVKETAPVVIEGKQIIEITAKGGYAPERSVAKAGIPTVIRFKTQGTFDCSSAVRIPQKNISKNLPQTGTTDIDIGTPEKGTLGGSCGMGMYPFEIKFE